MRRIAVLVVAVVAKRFGWCCWQVMVFGFEPRLGEFPHLADPCMESSLMAADVGDLVKHHCFCPWGRGSMFRTEPNFPTFLAGTYACLH